MTNTPERFTHGGSGGATIMKRVTEPDTQPKSYIVKGRKTYIKILAALAKAYPDFCWEECADKKQFIVTGKDAIAKVTKALAAAGLVMQPVENQK